jgi:hypothetical protein
VRDKVDWYEVEVVLVKTLNSSLALLPGDIFPRCDLHEEEVVPDEELCFSSGVGVEHWDDKSCNAWLTITSLRC